MNKGYAVFCDADRYFYDSPHRVPDTAPVSARAAHKEWYGAAARPVPEGWQRHRSGDWLALRPRECELPPQGWKIHVSACLDNAERVLETTMDYCLSRGIPFKFIPSRYLLHTRNAKYADRAGSGKFITVYPADDERFTAVAADLDALLTGEQGPYILSDLRWGAGPVYVRYGSFTRRDCRDADGVLRPAIADADGVLVPDPRGPVFRIPDWVAPPEALRPHLAARDGVRLGDLPYTVEQALHFSNGGGVYVARDAGTGERVVLKEARPHAGLAADGADAVARLRRERDALERLSGLDCVPGVRDFFELGGHSFLVLDHVAGRPLNSFFARRHPLIEADPDPRHVADFTAWALRIHGLVEEAVAAVHARGVVFNDLHLFNIMVSEDETSVVLLDFEAAAPVAENGRQVVANPAFVAPADRRGAAVDRYALACLRLALFIPLTSLFAIDRGKAAHLAQVVAETFPVPREFLAEAVAEIAGPAPEAPGGYLPAAPDDWPAGGASLVRGILAAATPRREDRYFPGDAAQFTVESGGLCFGNGAAGVLYALAESGAAPCPEAEEWLLDRTKRLASGTPPGFYDGIAGLAWTLHRLGHEDRALDLADLALREPWGGLPPDLHSGLAGLGLALDDLAGRTGEPGLADAAARCTALLADTAEFRRAGLLYGGAGAALLFVRRYERTGDSALLDLAAGALRSDLDRCVRGTGGALQVDEGWRTMPYLGAGSAGIGMVLDDYLEHRADERFEEARAAIVRAAQATFYAQPGLFRGAAGMVLYLSRTTAPGPGTDGAAVGRQLRALTWHAMRHQGELAFPGEQMMRLSTDLATGSAGCLLALAAARAERPARLPFLPPLRRPTSRLRLEP